MEHFMSTRRSLKSGSGKGNENENSIMNELDTKVSKITIAKCFNVVEMRCSCGAFLIPESYLIFNKPRA